MKLRGLMYADYLALSISVGEAVDQKDHAKALKLYEQIAEYFIEKRDVWQEIQTLRSILALSEPKAVHGSAAYKRLKALLEEIGTHAKNKEIRPMFIKFRKSALDVKNVNVLSTAVRYK